MNIALVSSVGDGAWIALCLQCAGQVVTWTIEDEKYKDILSGLLPPPVTSIDDPAAFDLVVFDGTGHGPAADAMREVTPVIGDSSFATKLENDRAFGIEFMEKAGIPVPPYQQFTDVADATAWLKETNKR